ncbi:MAG: PulJ/GspJ family protein [Planctomycetota bacterium]
MQATNRQHAPHRPAVGRRRAGMTLVEVIVATAVFAILLLGFGLVFSQTHKVVDTAESAMRANAKAAAITRTIRRDLSRASQQGLLALGYDDDGGYDDGQSRPRLILTAAGPTPSLTGSARGNGALVCLGARPKSASEADEFILWRAGYVLSPDAASGADVFDGGGFDLADLQALPQPEMGDLVDDLCGLGAYNDDLTVPPTNLGEIGQLWQVLSAWCTELEIAWTDGPAGGGGGGVLDWNEDAALWTHHDQNAWPVAIRIRFRLVDPTLPEEMRGDGYWYEVICPVGG